ncbi:MAG: polyprenyl synthetase family protein [Syntrophaceticus sp.]|nr:polyprenyl synthetase family protein [Syntrophaceticus sp.]
MIYSEILQEISSDLNYVEKELHRYALSSQTLLGQSSTSLVEAGGKRLRPAFVLLSGRFFQYDLQRMSQLAVAVELTHMGTLVHDDVIDDAATRRGRPTVRVQWGDSIALQTGNYLFAQALQIIDRYGNQEVLRILTRVSLEMCEGEIEQINSIGDTSIGLRHYLRRIQRKTAFLISACCAIGAMVGNGSSDLIWHLKKYGYCLGMAFQITDDILDFIGSEDVMGKPVGSDLRQGIITIPVIYALQDRLRGPRLQDIINKDIKTENDWDEAFSIIEDTGALNASQQLCDRYLQKAKDELHYLPDLPPRQILVALTDFIAIRNF